MVTKTSDDRTLCVDYTNVDQEPDTNHGAGTSTRSPLTFPEFQEEQHAINQSVELELASMNQAQEMVDSRPSGLESTQMKLSGRVGTLEQGQYMLRRDMLRGVASAIAISNTNYMPEDGFGVSAGYGSFHGTNETAFGASYRRGRVVVHSYLNRSPRDMASVVD